MTERTLAESMLEDLDLDEQPKAEQTSEEKVDDTPEQPPQVDTQPETSEEDTEAETTEDDTPEEPDVNELFEKYGFNQRFKNPAEMFEKINGHVTQVEQDRASLRKKFEELASRFPQLTQPAQPEPAKIDADSLLEDPENVLGKAGFVRQSDVQRLVEERLGQLQSDQAMKEQEREYNSFVSSKPDWAELEPVMINIAQKYPNIRQLPPAEAAAILYDMAKPRSPKPSKIEPSNKDKKARANTGGGQPSKKGGAPEVGSPEWLARTPLEEIEKVIGYHDN